MTDTTPSPDSGDITHAQENWEGRYAGLQKVLAKRDAELTTANTSLDALRKEHEQALADLTTYRQRDVDTSEEEAARAQYEQLRERFGSEETPIPVGNNAARTAPREDDWLSAGSRYPTRERTRTGTGWPIG